jgi:hypothetical protein
MALKDLANGSSTKPDDSPTSLSAKKSKKK